MDKSVIWYIMIYPIPSMYGIFTYMNGWFFIGECRYIMPYMDPMGSMFSLRPWSKVTFGCKLGADKHCLFNFPYRKELWIQVIEAVTYDDPNHGKKENVDYVFVDISFCFWLDVCWENLLEDEPTNPFAFSTPTDEMIQHSAFLEAFSPMWSFMIQMCQYSIITYLKVKIDGRDAKR